MSDTRPVELVLRLPNEMADSVEEVRDRDPSTWRSRVIRYGMWSGAPCIASCNAPASPSPFAHSWYGSDSRSGTA